MRLRKRVGWGAILTRNISASPSRAKFSGSVTILPVPEANGRGSGAAQLKLWFPAGRPPGLQEPLVATGVTGAGDIVYVRYVDDRRDPAFGFDHWGVGGTMSAPVEIDSLRAHQSDG